MEVKSFTQRLFDIQNEIRSAITDLVKEHQCIKIPFYYDFDENYDSDVEEEIKEYKEMGFNIQEGNTSDNTTLQLYDFFDMPHEDEIIGCRLNKRDEVEILSISNTYTLTDIANPYHLADLYDILVNCTNETPQPIL